jgi:uncharacterized protein (TIGR02452 family)
MKKKKIILLLLKNILKSFPMRKSKEELIEIWLDTEKRFKDYPNKITGYKSNKSTRLQYKQGEFNLTVENQDCMVVAERLSKLGRTCMLNMASYKHPGGGVMRGAMAQEEELSRRSNLMLDLTTYDYPLAVNDFIYSSEVTFFKDGNYQLIEPFDCDVITIAATNLNGLPMPKNYELIMRSKIRTMIIESQNNGCRNLVLSAFGCGVFKNDPYVVAQYFKDELRLLGTYFDNIVFAIINDRNSVASNYEIFNEVIG